jgi:diguanylate cyclase
MRLTSGFGKPAIQYLFSTTVDQLILKQKFSRLAHRDPLTNLVNRLMLSENVDIALKNLQTEQTELALHIVDLDYFKAANDTFGHLAGDAILKAVADRLTDLARNGDIVARIGGDEFVFIQVGIHHEEEAEMLARRIIRSLSTPYMIADQELRIGASIGIAVAPLHGLALEQLLARADDALYRSKQTRNRFTFASLQPVLERVAAG